VSLKKVTGGAAESSKLGTANSNVFRAAYMLKLSDFSLTAKKVK
jgi:hypothetical protein